MIDLSTYHQSVVCPDRDWKSVGMSLNHHHLYYSPLPPLLHSLLGSSTLLVLMFSSLSHPSPPLCAMGVLYTQLLFSPLSFTSLEAV